MALKYIPFRLVFFCCTNLVTEVQKRAKLHLDSMYSLQIKIYIVESGNKLSLSFHCILTTHSNQKRTLIKNKNMLNFKTLDFICCKIITTPNSYTCKDPFS